MKALRTILKSSIGAAVVLAVAPSVAQGATPRVLSGSHVVARVAKGPFVATRLAISGTVDLRPLKVVSHPFICRNCKFRGSIIASNTEFAEMFNIGGSQVTGGLVMDGASFHGPAVFGVPSGTSSTTVGSGIFTLAEFAGIAAFQGVDLKRSSFTLARFDGDALFTNGALNHAIFERASFAKTADFRSAEFTNPVSFSAAAFQGLADFGLARFDQGANFDLARFQSNASFVATGFAPDRTFGLSASFDHSAADGSVDFSSASFEGSSSFVGMSARTLSFANTTFSARRQAGFDDIATDDLVMSVKTADDAVQSENLKKVLGLIEAGAKTRNELGIANDAHYQLEVLKSNGYIWPWRFLDRVFYGDVAGYFVRPLRPLIILVLLIAVVAAFRTFDPRPRPAGSARVRVHRWTPRNVRANLAAFMTEFLNGFVLIGRGGGDKTTIQRLLTFTYRVLIACALLGLANSNPTLRSMFDAII